MSQLNHPALYRHVRQSPVPSDLFAPWENREGSCEESTLKANGHNVFQRVYEDACDEGFVMRSHRTGELRLFTLARTQVDGEGDVQWWEFTCYEGRGCSGAMTKVKVWND